jgi:hypothetical protein
MASVEFSSYAGGRSLEIIDDAECWTALDSANEVDCEEDDVLDGDELVVAVWRAFASLLLVDGV